MALKLLLALTLLAAAAAPSSSRVTDPGPIQTPEAARNGNNNQLGSPCLTSGSCHASAGEGPDGMHRQLWAQKDYISYEAMKRNSVPCTRPSVSYYNCRDNKAANPYRRSCTAITRCARYW